MFSDVPWCLASSGAFEGSIFQVSESKTICQELLLCSSTKTYTYKTEFSVFRRKSTERWWRAAESVCWDLSDLVFQRPWPTTGMGDGKSDLLNITLDSTKHTIFKNITDLQVFLTEYMGPLLIYLLFYVRVPNIYNHKYTFTSSPHHVVKYVLKKMTFCAPRKK